MFSLEKSYVKSTSAECIVDAMLNITDSVATEERWDLLKGFT
jgi:hypothetical protein